MEMAAPCIVRLLPLALAALAPEKLHQLRSTRADIAEVTSQSPHLARLMAVEKAQLSRGNYKRIYYTVEDFLRGESVESIIRGGTRIAIPEAEAYLRQSVEALGSLHAKGLLHGNLHSGKVFIDAAKKRLCICDWSHACTYSAPKPGDPDPLTQAINAVDLIGDRSTKRRRYMAPEVLYGFALPGPTAEQYALGLLLLEGISGRFVASGAVVDQNDYRRSVDRQAFLAASEGGAPKLVKVIERMTNLDPERRYQSLTEALADLNREPESDEPPPPAIESPPVRGGSLPLRPAGLGDLTEKDKSTIIAIIGEQARTSPKTAPVFLRDLLLDVGLPQAWAEDSIAVANTADARRLVDWVLAKKDTQSQTVLGGLLKAILPKLGFSESVFVVAAIHRYQLLASPAQLADLESRFLLPRSVDAAETATRSSGPDITWQVPDNDPVYQAWGFRPSQVYDVGFLKNAMEQCPAVCRIELPRGVRGTGFLVARDLVLTCWHVLAPSPGDDPLVSAREASLRFGAFTTADGTDAKGQVFRLGEDPIVDSSPRDELDYVLLRVEPTIATAQHLRSVVFSQTPPGRNDPLHILQHPAGDTMKLALCDSGVTWVSAAKGLVQYATATQGGSSGGPCFNDAWEVVAMHHAHRPLGIGSIREGVLLSKIRSRIQRFL